MDSQKAFGRRVVTRPQSRIVRASVGVSSAKATVAAVQDEWVAPPTTAYVPAQDDDLEEWKRARKFQIPWRQLSFMASACFGIASFVLPNSVNDKVDWLLYALMAISFVVGLSRRRKAKTAVAAPPR